MMTPVQPDIPCLCGGMLTLKPSRFGLFYGCTNYPVCDMTHCAHQETGKPMGTPATKEGRQWRMRAHAEFDRLWKCGRMKRPDAYRWMQEAMDMSKDQAHIGLFDIEQCQLLIRHCDAFWQNKLVVRELESVT